MKRQEIRKISLANEFCNNYHGHEYCDQNHTTKTKDDRRRCLVNKKNNQAIRQNVNYHNPCQDLLFCTYTQEKHLILFNDGKKTCPSTKLSTTTKLPFVHTAHSNVCANNDSDHGRCQSTPRMAGTCTFSSCHGMRLANKAFNAITMWLLLIILYICRP